ncbi:hypothetical protein C5Y41_22070 [Rahnella variigena]|nr:hypothetical protein C5Y41_22070 [Rahnella variigena]
MQQGFIQFEPMIGDCKDESGGQIVTFQHRPQFIYQLVVIIDAYTRIIIVPDYTDNVLLRGNLVMQENKKYSL